MSGGDPAGIDLENRAAERSAGAAIVARGRAMLASGEEFACTAENVTLHSARVVARNAVASGQVVVFHLDDIGILPGRIVDLTPNGFVATFTLKPERRARFARQLELHTKRANRTAELRQAPRIVPLHRSVEIRLGEQVVIQGTILNISMSGAAIALDPAEIPYVGARVRVGARFATVVRLLEHGIGVQFAEPFPADAFDEHVRP